MPTYSLNEQELRELERKNKRDNDFKIHEAWLKEQNAKFRHSNEDNYMQGDEDIQSQNESYFLNQFN